MIRTIDDTPSILSATDLLSVDDDGLFGPDNSERDDVLFENLVKDAFWLFGWLEDYFTLIWAFNARSSSSNSSLS